MTAKIPFGQWLAVLIVMAVLVVVSALAVAYSGHVNRQAFIELKQAASRQTELQVTHGKLVLERSTWTSPANVQSLAERELNMQAPLESQMVLVTAASHNNNPATDIATANYLHKRAIDVSRNNNPKVNAKFDKPARIAAGYVPGTAR